MEFLFDFKQVYNHRIIKSTEDTINTYFCKNLGKFLDDNINKKRKIKFYTIEDLQIFLVKKFINERMLILLIQIFTDAGMNMSRLAQHFEIHEEESKVYYFIF